MKQISASHGAIVNCANGKTFKVFPMEGSTLYPEQEGVSYKLYDSSWDSRGESADVIYPQVPLLASKGDAMFLSTWLIFNNEDEYEKWRKHLPITS